MYNTTVHHTVLLMEAIIVYNDKRKLYMAYIIIILSLDSAVSTKGVVFEANNSLSVEAHK